MAPPKPYHHPVQAPAQFENVEAQLNTFMEDPTTAQDPTLRTIAAMMYNKEGRYEDVIRGWAKESAEKRGVAFNPRGLPRRMRTFGKPETRHVRATSRERAGTGASSK